MKTKPRFQTIDTENFSNGQMPVWDADNNKFINSNDNAAINVKGDWVDATDYVKNDVVYSDGSSYVCILAHTSASTNEPATGADWEDYWQRFSAKGEDGAPGATGAQGPAGAKGDTGDTGATGAPGQGVPTGGTTGQVLAKNSGTDYDTEWVDPPEGGGGSGLELGETSSTAYRGDRGKIAYDHSQITTGNPHNVSKSDVGLSNVTNDAQLKASQLDTNASLGSDDTKIPSQKAVKEYVDNNAGGGGISAVEDDTSPTLGGELDADSNKIINLAAPTSNNDAATKKYVDDNAGGGGGGSVDIRDVWLFA